MRTIGIITLLISFFWGSRLNKMASKYFKEDSQKKIIHRYQITPTSFKNEDYIDIKGVKYRNQSFIIFLVGGLLSMVLIILGSL